MSLRLGIWKINANGLEGDFLIQSVQEGTFNAILFGRNITGFWDETSQTITFADISGVSAPRS
jgi:hypothetical protein